MARCKDCVHFGICKKGFPFADGKGGGWCEDFKSKSDCVPVVRCEKCYYSQVLPTNIESAFGVGVKHCQKRRGNNTNPFGLSTVSRDDFCSYGERREGE